MKNNYEYIDKATVVREINRIKKEECPIDTYEGRCKLLWFEQFLSFLNTLEVKEVNLEKEAENFVQTGEFIKNENPVLAIAKYFFELGLKAKEE